MTERPDGAVDENTAPSLLDTGQLTFDDVELADTHTAVSAFVSATDSVVGDVGERGIFDVAAAPGTGNASGIDSTGTGSGEVGWAFEVDAAELDGLAEGETVTQSYNVAVLDNHGGLDTTPVSVVLHGTNDAPELGLYASDTEGAVTEDSGGGTGGGGGGDYDLTSEGTLDFTDVDLIDTHTVSSAFVSSTDPGGQRGNLMAAVNLDPIFSSDVEVGWDFTVGNEAVQDLGQGQTITEVYDVTVDDGHGGTSTQQVSIAIVGANDAPVAVADTNAADAVVEAGVVPITSVANVNLDDVAAGIGGFKIVDYIFGEQAGDAVSGIGDVNHDGLADVALAATSGDYVVFGKTDGATVNVADLAAGIGEFQVISENANDFAARSISGLGDVNGDGRAELLVTATGNDAGGTDAGAAYVVFGKDDGAVVDLDNVAAGIGGFKIIGENAGDQLGYSISGVGDVNSDGVADILVGTYLEDSGGTDAGAAYLVYGKADGGAINLDNVAAGSGGFKIVGENAGDHAGWSVSGLGDFNGDGRADLLIGAPTNDAGGTDAGAAYVVFGKDDGATVNLDDVAAGTGGFKIIGENAGNQASYGWGAVSNIDDINNDGHPDLLIASLFDHAVYVVFGKDDGGAVNLDDVAAGTGGFKIIGESAGGGIGSVSDIGDVNGDGRPDLLIGDYANYSPDPYAGAAYVVYGKADGSPIDLADVAAGTGGFKILGEDMYDLAGRSVSGAGDVNGDGRPDALVGANLVTSGGGAAYVAFGPTATPVPGDPSASGNVLANDTDFDFGDSATVVGVAAGTPVEPLGDVASDILGTYGTLNLGADGSWDYMLDNNDPDTEALAQDAQVFDVFTYTMEDSAGATASATLSVEIHGTYDLVS